MASSGTRSAVRWPGEAAPAAPATTHLGGSLARAVRLVTVALITVAFAIPVGATWASVAGARGTQGHGLAGRAGGPAGSQGPRGLMAAPSATALSTGSPRRTAGATLVPATASPTFGPPTPSLAPTTVPAILALRPAEATPGPTRAPKPTRTSAPTAAPTPVPTAAPTPVPTSGWVTVINDQFNAGGVPSHWSLYDAPYGSGVGNCAAPSHVFVAGGVLDIRLSYEASGAGSAGCGPGWYSGGMSLSGFSSVDQQVTVRFRVVDSSLAVAGHLVIPMRWPNADSSWPAGGEEDYCEGDALTGCTSFLHYSASNQQISNGYSFDLRSWHTVRAERRNHVVRFYVDNLTTPVWTYVGNSTTLPDTLKHVVLQQECRSSGCPIGTSGSEDIQIDWITVANPG